MAMTNLKTKQTIGEKLSPVLEEIEATLWEFEAHSQCKPSYTKEGFRAALKIFMSALMDKMWELQEEENMEMKDRLAQVEKAGNQVKELVFTHTGIDAHTLYLK